MQEERRNLVPKFIPMNPSDVLIGRARVAAEERALYTEAVTASDAGAIELATNERPARVKRLLSEGSREAGKKIRSTWEDKRKRKLFWKAVGT